MKINKPVPVKMMDIADVTSATRIFARDYVSAGVPFYRGKEITELHRGALEVSTDLFITEEKFSEIKKKHGAPEEGDILLTSVGTLGSVYLVKSSDRFYFKDGNVTWFRKLAGVTGAYLRYWLTSPEGRAQLHKCMIGSSQSAYTIENLRRMEILLPPLETQRRIASILGAYDDLIEVNRRRIAVLEEMARKLFEEWFVRFRFPGHEDVPILDTQDGPLPKGWRLRAVGDLGDVVTGKTPSKAVPEFFGGNVPFVKIPDLHSSFFVHSTGETLSEEGAASQLNKTVPEGALCVSCIGTIGLVAITVEPCQTNQQINTLIPASKEWTEFLYFSLVRAKTHLVNLGANGATMGNVNKQKFSGVSFFCPTPALLIAFHELVAPMLALIRNAEQANRILAAARDLLLPRLISGQLSVTQAERVLEKAA